MTSYSYKRTRPDVPSLSFGDMSDTFSKHDALSNTLQRLQLFFPLVCLRHQLKAQLLFKWEEEKKTNKLGMCDSQNSVII